MLLIRKDMTHAADTGKDALQVKDTLQVRNEAEFKCTTRLTALTFYSTGLKSIMQHIRKRSDCAYSPSPRLRCTYMTPQAISKVSASIALSHTQQLSLSRSFSVDTI